jgi:transcriptional regulator with XRE-family HTH domain
MSEKRSGDAGRNPERAARLDEELRERYGGEAKTCGALARELDVAQTTLARWLEGGNIPCAHLERLAELGLDVSYIVTGTRGSEWAREREREVSAEVEASERLASTLGAMVAYHRRAVGSPLEVWGWVDLLSVLEAWLAAATQAPLGSEPGLPGAQELRRARRRRQAGA